MLRRKKSNGVKKRIERIMFYGAKPEIFENAKELRKNMTESENKLWRYLRNNQVDGFRFKALHPISKFTADFYSHRAKLAIEIGRISFIKRTKRI